MLSLLLLVGIIALMAASCVSLATPAEARTHAHRHHHYANHRRHVTEEAEQPSLWQRITSSVTGDMSLVTVGRQDLGKTAGQLGLPRSLWCADWVNRVLHRAGLVGTGSRAAASFARYGHNAGGPVVGSIAVMHRSGGGHVGIVTGRTSDGDPIIISGNNAGAVREGAYPRNRVYAYRR